MSFMYEPFTHLDINLSVDEEGNQTYELECDSCGRIEVFPNDLSVVEVKDMFFDHLVSSHNLTLPNPENHIKVLELRKQITDLQTQITELESGNPNAYSGRSTVGTTPKGQAI